MEDQSYKLILEGKLREGLERPPVIKKLSILLKRDMEEIADLLSGKPRVIAKGLDYRTALKYRSLLGNAGALSRIEHEAKVTSEREAKVTSEPEAMVTSEPEARVMAEPVFAAEQAPADQPDAAPDDWNVCPKCGYQPAREDDVLLVRGDCPRCGLQKRSSHVLDEPEPVPAPPYGASLSDHPSIPTIYGGRTPASWKRRALASVHTFLLFLAVYCCLAMVFILSFVPLESIPGYAGKGFLDAAFSSFPMFLPALSIILTSFVLPILNRGLSWGQRAVGIVVLYTQEALVGGLYLSLAFRVAAIGLVSFAPGLIVLWLGSTFGFVLQGVAANAVIIVTAILGWLGSWIYLVRNPEKMGILDRAGGTIQTEEEPLPEDAVKKALVPIGAVVGLAILLGIIIPLSLKALK